MGNDPSKKEINEPQDGEESESVKNVLREMEILQSLEHAFLVNLWFTFQDEEDMCMVSDLMMGGDLRFHVEAGVRFDEDTIGVYLAEIGLALEYLRSNNILHRDIKPDNVLLDEKGHAHLTDFNVATVVKSGQLPTALSGTKPYMAPEMFKAALQTEKTIGYSFPVDWWALGVTLYELLRGKRPFDIHANTTNNEAYDHLSQSFPHLGSNWSQNLCQIIHKLLAKSPDERISTVKELKQQSFVNDIDWDAALHKQLIPPFIPKSDKLNCDPTYELEEMIVESKPLHKKKKRLAANKKTFDTDDETKKILDGLETAFKSFDREREMEAQAAKAAAEKEAELQAFALELECSPTISE